MTFELISAAVSVGYRDDRGEDRVRLFGHRDLQAGAVVCDGVGSQPGSDETAERMAEEAVSLMHRSDVGSSFLEFDAELQQGQGENGQGATTLALVRADCDGLVGHFLIGNGAVIEVVAVETGPEQVRLLWSSIALPQMATHEGRPALASFLPLPDRKLESEKGIRKVPADEARLYLVCSDGVLSEEDRLEGGAPDGTIWQQVPSLMADLVKRLTDSWVEIVAADIADSATLLQRCLEGVIEPVDDSGTLDDDTTVAALLLRPAQPVIQLGAAP